MHDVAVLHDIFLAFVARLAGLLGRDLAAEADEVVVGDEHPIHVTRSVGIQHDLDATQRSALLLGAERVIAIDEPKLAERLIASARKKQVADLSVTLNEDYPVTWPGYGAGEEASRYVAKVLNKFAPSRGPYFALTHMLDSQVGTHLLLPSFSLPREGFDNGTYAPEVAAALKKYEKQFGPRGTSSLTTEKAPLEKLMGDARVIDVRKLVGSTKKSDWPASPKITVDHIKQYEAAKGPIRAGEIVLFNSGYVDAHYKPLPDAPEVDGMFVAPLAGTSEGWPAPTPEAVAYLADKGVRTIGTDGPTLGGVDRENALFVNWLAGTREMFIVEYLTSLAEIRERPAFFIFAPIKIEGTRGGYGRAIALY